MNTVIKNKLIGKVLKTMVLSVFLTLIVNTLYSQKKSWETSIRTDTVPIVIGDTNSMSYLPFQTEVLNYVDYNLTNRISLEIDKSYSQLVPTDTLVSIELMISFVNKDNQRDSFFVSLDIETLQKSLSSNFSDRQMYIFHDAFDLNVEIREVLVNGLPINVLPPYIIIRIETEVERYIEFDGTNSPTSFTIGSIEACGDYDDESIQVTWDPVTGAEEYQLEWTYVNDYDEPTYDANGEISQINYLSSGLEYDFKWNSTRISTKANHYRITNIFDHGYVLFRVRALGRNINNPEEIIYGVWNNASDQGSVNSLPSSSRYYNQVVHEGNKNWQYSATYAEEGKKKEVISYFDGSLRNRQSVTKTNTEKTVIVGQTIYDKQGRPAINVLPVPVEPCGTTENPIKYYESFNKRNNEVYGPFDFDNYATGSCSSTALPMNVVSGASNYYSSSNPNKTGQQAYLPNAGGYPFTQIQYTPDNTGRVMKQSGVGQEFKLGSGKEIVNYYGQPNQIQLDRMFGCEVGYASHYKKNLVFDANGQASVSYLNQEGKVIATSLAGNHPDSLDAILSEYSGATSLTYDLFSRNEAGESTSNMLLENEESLFFTTNILVASDNTPYSFDYDFEVPQFADDCIIPMCFGCVYDLEIIVKDGCGATAPTTSNDTTYVRKKVAGKFTKEGSVISFNTLCENTSYNNEFSLDFVFHKGEYEVSKILTLNEGAKSYYLQEYLDTTKNSCIKKLSEFQAEALLNVNFEDCNISCESCVQALGTKDEWLSEEKGTGFEWDMLVEKCKAPCKEIDVCSSFYNMMLLDVTLGGQYAECYEEDENGHLVLSPSIYNYSLLNSGNIFPGGGKSWRHPRIIINGEEYPYYLDQNGERAKIKLTFINNQYSPMPNNTNGIFEIDGEQYIYPENLKYDKDFISNWQPSFAKSLVMHHPEYCYYGHCSKYLQEFTGFSTTSSGFDQKLRETENYGDAVGDFISETTGLVEITNLDPFLASNSPYSTPSERNSLISKYSNYDNSGHSLVQFASYVTRFGTYYGYTPIASDYEMFGTGSDGDIKNAEWNLLKNLYLAAKNGVQQASTESGCTVSIPPNKIRRYYTQSDLESTTIVGSIEEANHEIYNQTGLCPLHLIL